MDEEVGARLERALERVSVLLDRNYAFSKDSENRIVSLAFGVVSLSTEIFFSSMLQWGPRDEQQTKKLETAMRRNTLAVDVLRRVRRVS